MFDWNLFVMTIKSKLIKIITYIGNKLLDDIEIRYMKGVHK